MQWSRLEVSDLSDHAGPVCIGCGYFVVTNGGTCSSVTKFDLSYKLHKTPSGVEDSIELVGSWSPAGPNQCPEIAE